MASATCCCGECTIDKFGLDNASPEDFATVKCPCPPFLYVLWRIITATYFLVWLVLSASGERATLVWFIYLTNWSFLILVVALVLQAILAVIVYNSRQLNYTGCLPYPPPWMSVYVRVLWLLLNVAVNLGLAVSCASLVWFLVYAPEDFVLDGVVVHTHIINSVYLCLNGLISCTPVRLLHFYQGTIVAAIYMIFNAIYTLSGGSNFEGEPFIYRVFDWRGQPAWATLFAVVFVVVYVPMLWCAVFWLCLIWEFTRKWMCGYCVPENDKPAVVGDVVYVTSSSRSQARVF